MDTFNNPTLSGVTTAPYDPGVLENSSMRDPFMGLVAAAIVVVALVAALRQLPGGWRLWTARAILSLLIAFAALMVPDIGNRIMSASSYDAVPRWLSQISLWVLSLAAACSIEWSVRIFQRGN